MMFSMAWRIWRLPSACSRTMVVTLLVAAFMLLTTAVAAHVIARAAARSGAPMWKGTLVDERPPHMTGRDSNRAI